MGESPCRFKGMTIGGTWCKLFHRWKYWIPSRYWANEMVCKKCGRKFVDNKERLYYDD